MKQKRVQRLILLLLLVMIPFGAWAAVGNDFGSYADDWGGGSGGGGYDSGYNGGGYYYYDNDYNGGDGESTPVEIALSLGVFLVIVAIIVIANNKKRGGSGITTGNNAAPVPNKNDEIVQMITQFDPAFHQDKFLAWVKEVYLTLQQAWTERKWESVRPFEKEELFRQHQMQLEEYKRNGTVNVLSRICINDAYLCNYERAAEYETLTVFINAKMIDYIRDEKTGNVISGNSETYATYNQFLTFMRKSGVLTNEATSYTATVSCPHCGAPTQITSSGECEYCNYIVTTGEFSWVLSNLEPVTRDNISKAGNVINRTKNSEKGA